MPKCPKCSCPEMDWEDGEYEVVCSTIVANERYKCPICGYDMRIFAEGSIKWGEYEVVR